LELRVHQIKFAVGTSNFCNTDNYSHVINTALIYIKTEFLGV
jgi:hypothetical protein